jgi:hypothetical protein
VLSDRGLARFARDNAWQPPLRTGLLLLRHGAAYVPQMPCFAQSTYIYRGSWLNQNDFHESPQNNLKLEPKIGVVRLQSNGFL